jgi:hypothetical protein
MLTPPSSSVQLPPPIAVTMHSHVGVFAQLAGIGKQPPLGSSKLSHSQYSFAEHVCP